MLFKGVARPRLDNLFLPEGNLNLAAIGSTPPPGDFSKSFKGLYFTKDCAVAHEYALWVHFIHDGNVFPVEILHVAVPQSLTASIN